MAKSKGMSVDGDWQAQDDARTLRMAEEIKCDPKRFTAAQNKAMKEMNAMKNVVKMKAVKKQKAK